MSDTQNQKADQDNLSVVSREFFNINEQNGNTHYARKRLPFAGTSGNPRYWHSAPVLVIHHIQKKSVEKPYGLVLILKFTFSSKAPQKSGCHLQRQAWFLIRW